MCRFLCGVGGSAALAAFGGVLSDVWGLADRAKANAILGTGLLVDSLVIFDTAADFQSSWSCHGPCVWRMDVTGCILEMGLLGSGTFSAFELYTC